MSFSENEIRFNLMTVKKDLREDLKSIIAKLSRSDIKNEKIKRDLNNNIALLNEINEKRENWEVPFYYSKKSSYN